MFSIDEYYPCGSNSIQSRNHKLHDKFLDQVDVRKENIHIPDGSVSKEEISDYCAEFDRIARGIDLLVIGVDEGGQVGFNEAGSTREERDAHRSALLHLKKETGPQFQRRHRRDP